MSRKSPADQTTLSAATAEGGKLEFKLYRLVDDLGLKWNSVKTLHREEVHVGRNGVSPPLPLPIAQATADLVEFHLGVQLQIVEAEEEGVA